MFFAGIGVGYFIRQQLASTRRNSIEAKLKKLLEDSKAEAKEILLEAKSKAVDALGQAKEEEKERERGLKKAEERLHERESMLDKRGVQLDGREADLAGKIERVREIKTEVEKARAEAILAVEKVAGMSKAEAKDLLVKRIEKESEEDLSSRIRKLETTGLEELERKAKSILATIIQRVATATTSEVTTTTVSIPNDDAHRLNFYLWRFHGYLLFSLRQFNIEAAPLALAV